MSFLVNEITTPPTVELAISWTPNGVYTTADFVAVSAPTLTDLTFTATTTVHDMRGVYDPSLLTLVEYRWDFGDGVISYGNPVHHTYTMTNPFIAVILRVTDSEDHDWFARAQMYLT